MKRLFNLKNSIAICLILFGLILAVEQRNRPSDHKIDLNIDKPTDEVLVLVEPIANLISDPTDRAKLAIFNQEFAQRILSYTASNQQTNDVYVLAASHFFKDSINDKYANLDTELVKLLESSIGNENHVLSDSEKEDIAKKFTGLSWVLIERK
jgi:hypothetical protein